MALPRVIPTINPVVFAKLADLGLIKIRKVDADTGTARISAKEPWSGTTRIALVPYQWVRIAKLT